MSGKPTYDELVQRIIALEQQNKELRAATDLPDEEAVPQRETDKIQAEEKWWESEKNNALFSEVTLEGIWVIDTELKTLEVNKGLCAMLGYSQEEMIGKTPFDFVDAENKKIFLEQIAKVSTVKDRNYEITLRKKNNESLHAIFNATTITDKSGEILGSFAFVTDISKRRQIEQDLQDNNEILTSLINATPDIVCFKDGKGRWLLANDADLRLFELTGVDYQGKTDSELAAYTPFYRDAFLGCEETDEEAWKNRVLSKATEVIATSDGAERILEVIKVPLFYSDGRRKGLVVLGHDVTERLKSEEILRQEIAARKDANIALRVLLEQQNSNYAEIEQRIQLNLRQLVIPHFNSIRQQIKDEVVQDHLDIIQSHLSLIGDSFTQNMNSLDLRLTQREIVVVDLIREGKKTKEIARLLNLSPRSIETYRNNIRKKLNINKEKVNLQQYLLSKFSSRE